MQELFEVAPFMPKARSKNYVKEKIHIIIITLIVKSSKGFSSTIYNNICIPKNNKNIEKFKNLKLRESLP